MWFTSRSHTIICIGSASQDIFFPTDDAVIIETPEEITSKQKIAFELGGKYRVADRYEAVGGVAANVSCGLARLGHRAAAYSCIGDDEIGRFVMSALGKEGVATDLIRSHDATKTDLSAIIVMTQNGERTIFHNRDANERLTVDKDKLKDAKWLFVSALNGEWKKNLAQIKETKKEQGMFLALNPGQHNIREDATLMLETLALADVLLLNKDEAIELLQALPSRPTDAELDNERFLLEQLFQAGAKTIGMTDGKRGAWGYDGKEFWACPIYTLNGVVDSTGAGDAFGSGFLAAHMAGLPLSDALRYGIANSGSVVGAYGAIAGLLTSEKMAETIAHIVPKRLD